MAADATETAFKQEEFDWGFLSRLKEANINLCNYQLNDSKFMTDLREAKFDIIFGHMTDACWLGWVHLLNVSTFVWMSEGLLLDMFAHQLRIPGPPSHVPHFFQSLTDEMNLKERTINGLAAATTPFITNYFMDPMTELFRKRFGPEFPDLSSLLGNAKLVVINSEEFLDYPRPIFHKILYVGGLGIEDPKPLDEKWKNLMENKKYNGTVLFSMGSVAKASKIPMNVRVGFDYFFVTLKP